MQNESGRVLHLATSQGNADVVTMLIAFNAKVTAKDDRGNTALHCAVSRGHEEAVEALLKCSPQIVKQLNGRGESAHSLAVYKSKNVEP